MDKKDIIFAIICGLAVAWIAVDFLGRYGRIFFLIFPALSIIGLWLVDLIGKKRLFVRHIGRFVLVGAFADVIDIKVFQFLFWIIPLYLIFKVVSFLAATFVKFWWNKHWTFEKYEKKHINREVVQFFIVTLMGLAIDVVLFYYFSRVKTGISTKLWIELSIIFAAIVAAIWNFLGYKFLVFKKQ